MKTLLLSLGLGLVAALQAQTLPTVVEEEEEDLGTWYLKAVTFDKEIPGGKLGPVSVTPMTIKILDAGNVKIKFAYKIADQCHDMSITLEETEVPGKYTAYGGKHVVQIMKSSVEDHYILYDVTDLHGRQIRTAKLVGRDPDLSQEALKDFENVTGARGLSSDTIVIPKQMETCSPGGD
ncbi:von Ebner gland protein 1-like [Perognathus longimembris pacificus]|uniref:von Ebner gland protein 1-like n=1 Tax=Perognathus longimembris pacificus TaxID=214514 RepID=UPI002018F196|nr:von Ebner gland protein 1-like [Perognathus longimembris pacificus]